MTKDLQLSNFLDITEPKLSINMVVFYDTVGEELQ